jgi:hypothetical protein
MQSRASGPSTRTFGVDKLDITGRKFDDPICDANPLFHHKDPIHHVNEAVLKGTLPNESNTFASTDCFCLGGCIDVDLVKRDKVLLVISR